MKVNNMRYGVISMFGTFAISSCVVAYPDASFYISFMGSMFVGFCCAGAASFGEERL